MSDHSASFLILVAHTNCNHNYTSVKPSEPHNPRTTIHNHEEWSSRWEKCQPNASPQEKTQNVQSTNMLLESFLKENGAKWLTIWIQFSRNMHFKILIFDVAVQKYFSWIICPSLELMHLQSYLGNYSSELLVGWRQFNYQNGVNSQ